MNKKGKQQLNNEAVFKLLDKATKLSDGSYIFTDLSNSIFLVDTDGTMHQVTDDMIRQCNTGKFSRKKNGYIYVEITVDIDGQVQTINYAQHSIVCALFNGLPYDNNLVVNHKNNCPFDNTPSNLEWTTNNLNILHGRIVEAAIHAHNSEHSLAWLGYDLYKQTSNNKYNFDCLKLGISCQDITAYEQYIIANNKRVKSLKQYWGLTDKNSLLSLYEYDQFIKWWDKHKNINLKEV